MKRFRFAADSLLALRRIQLERLEADREQLLARRRSSLDRAQRMLDQEGGIRRSLIDQQELTGAELRRSAEWTANLRDQSGAAAEAARRLLGEAQKVEQRALPLRRQVRLLERLREKRLGEYHHRVDADAEKDAGELFLLGGGGRVGR